MPTVTLVRRKDPRPCDECIPLGVPVTSKQQVSGHRPVVIYTATSLDGYLAPRDGSVDWLEPFGEGPDLGIDAFLDTVGSLVTGRTTFDQVRSFGVWPYGQRPTAVLTRRADDGQPLANPGGDQRRHPGRLISAVGRPPGVQLV